MRRLFLLPILCLLASCASREVPTDPPTAIRVGVVRLVNAAEGFVLVESTSAVAISPGAEYRATNAAGERTAALRATPLRRHPFQVADIIEGAPSPGDTVQRVEQTTAATDEKPSAP